MLALFISLRIYLPWFRLVCLCTPFLFYFRLNLENEKTHFSAGQARGRREAQLLSFRGSLHFSYFTQLLRFSLFANGVLCTQNACPSSKLCCLRNYWFQCFHLPEEISSLPARCSRYTRRVCPFIFLLFAFPFHWAALFLILHGHHFTGV